MAKTKRATQEHEEVQTVSCATCAGTGLADHDRKAAASVLCVDCDGSGTVTKEDDA